MKTVLKRLLRLPANAIVGSSENLAWHVDERLRSPVLVSNPHLGAVFYPYRPGSNSYVIKSGDFPAGTRFDENRLPVPPKESTTYYIDADEYLESGKERAGDIRRNAEATGFSFDNAKRILDFGCADGRVIRWFHDLSARCEVWGVDIHATKIVMCQTYLSPPFRFATTTSFPHLPFEDGSFDFIYAMSVFTHIPDLADAWLLELKRILRPGGLIYATVHDEFTIQECLDPANREEYKNMREMIVSLDKEQKIIDKDFNMFTINRAPGPGYLGEAQVFYKADYLRRHWGSMLDFVTVIPGGSGYQTVVMLTKPGP